MTDNIKLVCGGESIEQIIPTQPGWQAVHLGSEWGHVFAPVVCWALVREDQGSNIQGVIVDSKGQLGFAKNYTGFLGYNSPGSSIMWEELAKARREAEKSENP